MKTKYSWLLAFALIFVAFSCQVQNEGINPSKDASARAAATPGAYNIPTPTSPDGYTWTFVIDQSAAQDISNLNFQFHSCADSSLLTLNNVSSLTVNGQDWLNGVNALAKTGDGTGSCSQINHHTGECSNPMQACLNQFTGDVINLTGFGDAGISGGTVTVVIELDTKVVSGSFLIKSATDCWGLGQPSYAFSRSCVENPCTQSQDETAWAGGPRYVSRGNWATYTPYQAGTVNVYAGQNMHAGTATLSAVSGGMVTITIALNAGWGLQNVSNPVKIQGYSSAPSGNPSPGRFASKGSSLTVTVPADNFYGIHVDVKKCLN